MSTCCDIHVLFQKGRGSYLAFLLCCAGYGAKETPTYATATTTAPTGTVYSTERGATTTTTGPAAAV